MSGFHGLEGRVTMVVHHVAALAAEGRLPPDCISSPPNCLACLLISDVSSPLQPLWHGWKIKKRRRRKD